MDREAGTVFLWTSKNKEPRTFPLRDAEGRLNEVGELIEKRWTMRAYEAANGPALSRFVFHVAGHRVWNLHHVWPKAAAAANLPGRLFHDYRRTAVRDLVRAGVPQAVAMSITGHKTDSVFRRYNITSDADKVEAVARLALASYRASRPAGGVNVVEMARGWTQVGHKGSETSPEASEKSRNVKLFW